MDYLMLVAATMLLAVNFVVSKYVVRATGSSVHRSMLNTLIIAAMSFVLMWAINGFAFHVTLPAVLYAAGKTAAATAYTLIMYKIIDKAPVSLNTFFLMSGGMIVPYIYGILFLDETFSVLRTVGLILIFVSLFLKGGADVKKVGKKILLMCLAVFALNGCVSVFSKLHQILPAGEGVNSAEFSMIGSVMGMLAGGVVAAVTKPAENEPPRYPLKKVLPICVLSSAASAVSYLLQLNSASNLPATVVYPIITGGAVIFTGIAAMIMLREKPDRRTVIGMILCLAGTCCFL